MFYRRAQGFQIEIVEQDEFCARVECLVQLQHVFHFDLHGDVGWGEAECRSQHGFDTARRRDVVFLDEDAVIESDPLVVSAACQHGVFLRQAQTGQGFSRVHDFHWQTRHRIYIAARGGGGGR